MNIVILIGHLARKPESRTTQNNNQSCTFTVAVNRPQSNGKQQQNADFIQCRCYGKLAEACLRYLDKGSKVAVMGKISAYSYQNKDGVTQYITEVTANTVDFLSPKNEGASTKDVDYQELIPDNDTKNGFVQVDLGDDLPF